MKLNRIAVSVLAVVTMALGSCGEDATAPAPAPAAPAHHYTRADLTPQGQVVQTANGYTVEGALLIDNGQTETSFQNADLDVQFNDEGVLTGISGSAEIPPPSDNVSFTNPIQADVGFFTGKFLNANRDFPILLKDQVEYFVFYVALAVEMKIKDDDTPEEKAISVKAPVGGQVLMLADYTDPMYFVYGEDDLAGAFGYGESIRGRIPYVPERPAKKIYSFGGKSVRTGTFEVKNIFEVTGTIIERTHVGIDLMSDPITADLEAGYSYGLNGSMDLVLPIEDVVDISLPIAAGSAALRAEAGTNTGAFAGAFIDGIAEPYGWWPDVIPIKPVATLLVRGNVETTGAFDVLIHGEYGIEVYSDPFKLVGDFHATVDALTVAGSVVTGDATYKLTGTFTGTETTVSVAPPPQLLALISGAVNSELDQSISAAEKAWDDLVKATADYEFELNLRGFRAAIPTIVDVAKSQIASNINYYLSQHEGTVYYNSLRDFLYSVDDPYIAALDRLKALALSTQDTAAWRAGIEAALRTLANYAWFDETYEYKVLGQVIVSVHIRVRILSDAQVAQLLLAANNVKYIEETWSIKLQMQQIYDAIPAREIFERVRDEIENGIVAIPTMTEFGFVKPHASPDIAVFAMINGARYTVANTNIFDLAEMSAALAKTMVQILIE